MDELSFQIVINDVVSINQSLPLILAEFGINYTQEVVIRTQGIPFYQWIQCVSGKGELNLFNQKFIIAEGCGVFILPNVPHSYKGITNEWKVNYVCFKGNTCNEILHGMQLNTTDVFKLVDPLIIEKQIYKFYEIYRKSKAFIHSEYSCALYEFLIKLSNNVSRIFSAEIVSENLYVELVIQHLEKNYMKPIALAEIAEVTNFSKEYLCSLFKKNMKQTIISYLQIIRIANARILLVKYPNKSVAQIGSLCGFENASYFCKVFRKIEGVTPQVFRERC